MEHEYYLPKDDPGKVLWLQNFGLKLPTYATTLGISSGILTSVSNDATYYGLVIGLLGPFKEYGKAIIAYKDALRDGSPTAIGDFPSPPAIPAFTAVPAGVFIRLRDLVKTIKAHPNYTSTIGTDLGIIGTEINPDFATIKPHPKVSLKNSHAYLQWAHEHTDAADIKADYGDGAGFVTVGRILKAHSLDPHLPAAGTGKVYKYIIRYVVSDEEVGFWSDEISITVTG
jgi:hypothetical protein